MSVHLQDAERQAVHTRIVLAAVLEAPIPQLSGPSWYGRPPGTTEPKSQNGPVAFN
jgi:hypothetical protein